jgi:hypothetical protein
VETNSAETNAHQPVLPPTVDPIGQLRLQIVGPGRLQSLWSEPVDPVTAALVVDYNRACCPEWTVAVRENHWPLHLDVEAAFGHPAAEVKVLRRRAMHADGSQELLFAVRYVRLKHARPLPAGCRAPGVIVSQEKLQLSPPLVALEAHHLGGDFDEPILPPAWLVALVGRWCDLHAWVVSFLFLFPAMLLPRLWRRWINARRSP